MEEENQEFSEEVRKIFNEVEKFSKAKFVEVANAVNNSKEKVSVHDFFYNLQKFVCYSSASLITDYLATIKGNCEQENRERAAKAALLLCQDMIEERIKYLLHLVISGEAEEKKLESVTLKTKES